VLDAEQSFPNQPTASSVSDQPSAASPHEEMRDLTAAEKSILADGFAAGLDDPDSVKFRWAQVPKSYSGHAFELLRLDQREERHQRLQR
jgi:hypothetical protein